MFSGFEYRTYEEDHQANNQTRNQALRNTTLINMKIDSCCRILNILSDDYNARIEGVVLCDDWQDLIEYLANFYSKTNGNKIFIFSEKLSNNRRKMLQF